VREWLAEMVRAHAGLLLEEKGDSLAVHYRSAPELTALVEETVRSLVDQHAPAHDLQPGKMVLEIKPRGVNKGRAIEALLELPAFAGRRPAMFGDDLTDEFGFRIAQARGGEGTLIGMPERLTAATSRLGSPADLRGWLAREAGLTGAAGLPL
jgi:trehalose 6-phosphate phosphatase